MNVAGIGVNVGSLVAVGDATSITMLTVGRGASVGADEGIHAAKEKAITNRVIRFMPLQFSPALLCLTC